jgi:uncharacterized protein YndB with AHSA1/START domain
MTGTEAIDPIRASVTLEAPPADAFAGFSDGMSTWWPREFTWSGELLERIGMDGHVGGFCHEVGAGGMRLDWGRVSSWEPPRRLAFSWQIGPDRVPQPNPAKASQVEVSFEPLAGDRATVTVVHRGWERHGEGGRAYRDQFAAARVWETILEQYAAAVGRRVEAPWTGLTT